MKAGVHPLRIVEGTLKASARLAIDLIPGKIAIPLPFDPESPLAQHETSLATFIILFRVPLIRVVGYKMTHDLTVECSVDPVLVDIYLASAVPSDPTRYS